MLMLRILLKTTNAKEILLHTSIGTKSEVAQFLACSFQQFYSTHMQDKHSQKSSCQQIDKIYINTTG